MGVLTDTDLKKIITENRKIPIGDDQLMIQPFSEDSLTPVGYDLRIGSRYASRFFGKYYEIGENESIRIRSGDTVLVSTLERIEMPRNFMLSGLISSKVSIVSKGITHISTTIDPDWKGNLVITISNVSKKTVELKYGEKFCTAVFLTNESRPGKLSNHEESRNEIFLTFWASQNKNALFKERLKMLVIFSIIPISILVGWIIFGNAEGMSAIVAGSVTLTMILKEIFL